MSDCSTLRATLIGVASWSEKEYDEQTNSSPCDDPDYAPSVYARINYDIMSWIQKHTDGACTSTPKKLSSLDFPIEVESEDLLDEERSQLLDEIKFGLDEIVELQNEKANGNKESEKRAHSAEESDIIQGWEL